MKISVIIPTLNEAENISGLIKHLQEFGGSHLHEVIVVDGGSYDDTLEQAVAQKARVFLSEKKNRAFQMNLGANRAKGDILYFIHADALPPKTFAKDIVDCAVKGHHLGCYRLRFNSSHPMLKFNSWYTRFNGYFSGGGDQSLFILKDVFNSIGGYDESRSIMEDFDLVRRAKKKFTFCVMPKEIVVSARKYNNNSYLRVNISNLLMLTLNSLHFPNHKLAKMYRRMLRPSNIKVEKRQSSSNHKAA
jgi:rSAM/selenodomain-associated transferase 2